MFLPPRPLVLHKDPNFSAWGSKGNNMLSPSVCHKHRNRKTRKVKKSCTTLRKSEYFRLFLRNWFPSISASLAPRHHFPCHVRSSHPATSGCLPTPPSDTPVGRTNHSKCSDLHCLILFLIVFYLLECLLFIYSFISLLRPFEDLWLMMICLMQKPLQWHPGVNFMSPRAWKNRMKSVLKEAKGFFRKVPAFCSIDFQQKTRQY